MGGAHFFHVWARQHGPQKFAAMLKDPAIRAKIKQDKDFQTWVSEHGGWEGVVMGRARQPQNKKYKGMRIPQIAKVRGDKDFADTCIELMAEEGGSHLGYVPHDVRGRCASGDAAGRGSRLRATDLR